MTIFEIADCLPNGLHDAEVDTIRIDYPHRTMELKLDVWIGTMGDPPSTRETYRRGVLTITGFRYCAMDLPDEQYPFAGAKPLTIDLFEATAFCPDPLAFSCRLWVNEWNGFIHLSGVSAKLVWQGEPVNRNA